MVLSEERLEVVATRVPVERVRVRKRIVTEDRTVTVTVRREELAVERFPVDPDAPVDGAPGRDDVVTLVLHEEVPEVTTRVVPRERVRVHVETRSAEEQVSAELGREVLDVDETSSSSSGEWPAR